MRQLRTVVATASSWLAFAVKLGLTAVIMLGTPFLVIWLPCNIQFERARDAQPFDAETWRDPRDASGKVDYELRVYMLDSLEDLLRTRAHSNAQLDELLGANLGEPEENIRIYDLGAGFGVCNIDDALLELYFHNGVLVGSAVGCR